MNLTEWNLERQRVRHAIETYLRGWDYGRPPTEDYIDAAIEEHMTQWEKRFPKPKAHAVLHKDLGVNLSTLNYYGEYVDKLHIPELDTTVRLRVFKEETPKDGGQSFQVGKKPEV